MRGSLLVLAIRGRRQDPLAILQPTYMDICSKATKACTYILHHLYIIRRYIAVIISRVLIKSGILKGIGNVDNLSIYSAHTSEFWLLTISTRIMLDVEGR